MKSLIHSIFTDKKTNSFKSFLILMIYRLEHHAYVTKHIGFRLIVLAILKEFLFSLFRIDAMISYKAEIGDNIRLLHNANGVVISKNAVIYDNKTIYHQVTIGINENKPADQKIIIHENCYLCVGCKIISAEVGKNSTIGANAVVFKDIPSHSLIVSQNLSIR